MEAIRRFLRLWKKIHFWVLIPVVLLVAAVGYVLASSKVWGDYDKYASTIKTMVSDAGAVSSKTPHPNSEYLSGMDAMMQQRTKNVFDAWTAKAERQEKHLKWPEQLSPVFLKAVEGRRPIEKFDPADKRSHDLHISLREEYRDLIRGVLPQLAESIGSKWHVVDTAGDGVSTLVEMEDPDGESTLVGWSRENQEQLINSRFTWSRAEADAPSTMEVMYAQEDLWVLQALMRIIQRTNEGATDRTRAVVKEIESIRLANDVVTDAGEIDGVAAGGAAAADPLAAAAADPLAAATGDPGSTANPLGIPGEGAGLTAAARRNPADNRYVDRDYKKLTAEELITAVKAEDPQNAYLAVAKRIPVQMRLLVDTRRLNRLLAELANEELTVEVRQLRMGCMASQAPDSLMGIGNRYGGYGASGYGASGYGASGGYGATPPTADGAAAGTEPAAGGASSGGGYGGTGYGGAGYGGGYGVGTEAAPLEVYDPDHAESAGAATGTGIGGASGYGGGAGRYGGGYGGGAGRYGGGYGGGAGRYGGGYGGGYGGSSGAEDGSAEGKPRGRYNQYVEIMGIVYIFNPVNKTVLGVEEEGAAEGDSSGESTEEAAVGDVAAAEPQQ